MARHKARNHEPQEPKERPILRPWLDLARLANESVRTEPGCWLKRVAWLQAIPPEPGSPEALLDLPGESGA
jgi:hypothetical protein